MRGDCQRVRRMGESWRAGGDRGGDEGEPVLGLATTTPSGVLESSTPLPVAFEVGVGRGTVRFCAQLPSSQGASSSIPTLPSPLLSSCWKAATALGLILSSHSVLDICWASIIFFAATASLLATGRPSLTR